MAHGGGGGSGGGRRRAAASMHPEWSSWSIFRSRRVVNFVVLLLTFDGGGYDASGTPRLTLEFPELGQKWTGLTDWKTLSVLIGMASLGAEI